MSATQQRSTFVNVLAWIFIVLSGFGTVIAILQNIMVHTVFNRPEFNKAIQNLPPDTPPITAYMMSHFQWLFLAVLLMSLFMFISSIGLLKRLNWARLCFIGLMALAIAWQLVGLGIQFSMFSSMHTQFSAASSKGVPDMTLFFIAMAVFSVVMALGFSVLFGWIIRKLVSAPIAAEFRE